MHFLCIFAFITNFLYQLGRIASHKFSIVILVCLRALAHLAFVFALALISFDVCRHVPSLGVSNTIENNGSQMHHKCKSKRKC